jgi:hypothetical protein
VLCIAIPNAREDESFALQPGVLSYLGITTTLCPANEMKALP